MPSKLEDALIKPLRISVATLCAALAGLAVSTNVAQSADTPQIRLPTISVSLTEKTHMKDTLLITGTFVAREEVLVSPEIEGFAIIEVLAEEGDRVEAGQTLTRLNKDGLLVQLAQNSAQIARATASIDNAKAQISEAEANREQAAAAFERARALRGSGTTTAEIFDQRQATARVAEARVNAARQSLNLAEADKVLAEKQRSEIELRLARCDIKAPVSGIIARRTAKIGQIATAAGTSEPLFRLIARGEIDLEADVPETHFARLKAGQLARLDVLGRTEDVAGKVRLVAPEMNRTTRLGRVRISIEAGTSIPLGAFGRGIVLIGERDALVVPLSAVSFGAESSSVQVVKDGIVITRKVETGMRVSGRVEIRDGLKDGEEVVTVSGSFVRDGDRVRPVPYTASQ